jgi:hypothetical protein
MLAFEDIKPGARLHGLDSAGIAEVVQVSRFGANALNLVFRVNGRVAERLVYRGEETSFELVEAGRAYAFDADGALLRLASEAYRIRLAHLFDPYLAVSASQIEALPHQITAVYGEMLPCQPLRFLLADDPGAGNTIEAPCQCIVSGGILTVSSGFSTCGFSPLKQMRPTPDKQKSVCPTGWECHAVRAPGVNVNDRTSKARRRLGGDHRILEHDTGEGLGGTPPGIPRPRTNDSGFISVAYKRARTRARARPAIPMISLGF